MDMELVGNETMVATDAIGPQQSMDLINTLITATYNATLASTRTITTGSFGGGFADSDFGDGGAGNLSSLSNRDYEDDEDYVDDKDYIFDKLAVRALFLTLYTIVFCSCFFGNFAVILVIGLHWRMRSITNFCLANLSFANLCVGVFCIFQNLSLYLINSWVFGIFFCKMYHFTNSMSHTASILILVVICIERYMVICHPLKCKRLLTLNRLRVVIVGVWIISAIYCSPRLYYITTVTIPRNDGTIEILCIPKRTLYDSHIFDMMNFLLIFLVPMTVISVLYTIIGVTLWKSNKPMTPSGSVSSAMSSNPNEYAVTNCGAPPFRSNSHTNFNDSSNNTNLSLNVHSQTGLYKNSSPRNSCPSKSSIHRKSSRNTNNTSTSNANNTNCNNNTGSTIRKKLSTWSSRRKCNRGFSKCFGKTRGSNPRRRRLDYDVDVDDDNENEKGSKNLIANPETDQRGERSKGREQDKKTNLDADGQTNVRLALDLGSDKNNKNRKGGLNIPIDNEQNEACSTVHEDKFKVGNGSTMGLKKKSFLFPLKLRREKFSKESQTASSPSPSSSSIGVSLGDHGIGSHSSRANKRTSRKSLHISVSDATSPNINTNTNADYISTVARQASVNSNQSTNTNWNSPTTPPTSTTTTSCSNPNLFNVVLTPTSKERSADISLSGLTCNFASGSMNHKTLSSSESGASGNPPKLKRAMAVRTIRIGAHAINSRRRVVRMLIVFVLTFFIFNIPYHARKIWQIMSVNYDGGSTFSALLTPITFLFMYSNCAINPILIFTMSSNFRASFKDLISCRMRRTQKQTQALSFHQ